MSEYNNIIIFWIIFSTLLISTTNNYISFLRYYVLQVCFILVLFYMMYSWSFMSDKLLLTSFIFAIIIRLIIIPIYINYFIKEFYVKKLQMRVTDRVFRIPQSLVFLILIWFFFLSYYLAIFVFWEINFIFTVSFFVFFAWLLNFVNHKRLVWDILSFLEIENAIFIIWLMILEKVPFYIEFGIIIDVILVLLILLILVYNIKQVIWDTEISHINHLKY
jgi:hydrogenase-4 membrane subunit HyfE